MNIQVKKNIILKNSRHRFSFSLGVSHKGAESGTRVWGLGKEYNGWGLRVSEVGKEYNEVDARLGGLGHENARGGYG